MNIEKIIVYKMVVKKYYYIGRCDQNETEDKAVTYIQFIIMHDNNDNACTGICSTKYR